ncbi:MAG: hypothetical protein ACK5P7_12805 [Bdellovibrio sp.]|jgi:hypothetical protein
MKTLNLGLLKQLTLVLLGLLIAETTLAQAVTSMALKLDRLQKSSRAGDPIATLDLLGEAKRQNTVLQNLPSFDLNRVEVMMKSGIGGAAAYLVVNGAAVDSNSVETDPDLFAKPGNEAKVELKNLERRVDTAVLNVIGKASISTVTIFFGAISEPAILGSYATGDATRVGDATAGPVYAVRPPESMRPGSVLAGQRPGLEPLAPPIEVLPAPGTGPGPVVIAPPIQPRPPVARWEDSNCVQGICVGDTVVNNFGFDGLVLRVFIPQGMVEVKFGFSNNAQTREVRQVKLKAKGRRGL